MLAPQPVVVMLLALVGNCGFWLFCFNRANSTGMPRRATKSLEKLCILLCFAIPLVVCGLQRSTLVAWCFPSSAQADSRVATSSPPHQVGTVAASDKSTNPWWPPAHHAENHALPEEAGDIGSPPATWAGQNITPLRAWLLFGLGSLLILAPGWLESRRWILPPRQLLSSVVERYHVAQQIGGSSAANRSTRWLEQIPGNQISQLEVARKELQLSRPIAGVNGLVIGHLSDLHFTGQLSIDHYHYVLERFLDARPDLIVITGDIIDYRHCLPWIAPLLGKLTAPYGCTYLLGNHDKRLGDLRELLDTLEELGHFDLGVRDQHIQLAGGATVWLTGNESPWLRRHKSVPSAVPPPADSELRLGLSHSPDKIGWARRLQLDLLLAGHTHGGQVRLPGIGPIVSPSRYGSRFASGVFFRSPTLMHVSRGLAGTHPLRIRCRPEACLLTLRCPD